MWNRPSEIDRATEEWHYKPLAREILGKISQRMDVSHLIDPDMKLIEWIAREGGTSDYAIRAIMDCAYRGLLGTRHVSPFGEMKSEEENKIRAYGYVPSDRWRFAKHVLPLFYGKRRFIDVGSGYADKPFLAHVYGKFETVTGLELNAFTHSAALLLLGALFGEEHVLWREKQFGNRMYLSLLNENAFDISFEKYDAVYMYMPIADAATMTKLHAHVINTMPVGGMLYEVQTGLFNRRTLDEDRGWWECRCPHCRDGDEDKCIKEGDSLSFFEYAEEVGAPIKRDIDISHERHLITIRR